MTALSDRCDEAAARAMFDERHKGRPEGRVPFWDDQMDETKAPYIAAARIARLALLVVLDAEGWGVRPDVATEGMVNRGCDELPMPFSDLGDEDAVREIYASMNDVAPSPFGEPQT